MPRRPATLPAEAHEAMGRAAQLCEALHDCDERTNERDELWEKAHTLGATYAQIGESCGLSEHTVRLRVQRVRGAKWAGGNGA